MSAVSHQQTCLVDVFQVRATISTVTCRQVGQVPADETTAEIPNLVEGKEYEFRVIPVNEAGQGEPSSGTVPIVTKARRGMQLLIVY